MDIDLNIHLNKQSNRRTNAKTQALPGRPQDSRREDRQTKHGGDE